MRRPKESMSLARRLEELVPPTHDKCAAGRLVAQLDEEDAVVLEKYLADERFSARVLSDVLREEGHVLNRGSIGPHRKKTCVCYKKDNL